eukprot:COSAG01_NODE_7456_length_3204_cov_2.374557_3_plen_188_part_00
MKVTQGIPFIVGATSRGTAAHLTHQLDIIQSTTLRCSRGGSRVRCFMPSRSHEPCTAWPVRGRISGTVSTEHSATCTPGLSNNRRRRCARVSVEGLHVCTRARVCVLHSAVKSCSSQVVTRCRCSGGGGGQRSEVGVPRHDGHDQPKLCATRSHEPVLSSEAGRFPQRSGEGRRRFCSPSPGLSTAW